MRHAIRAAALELAMTMDPTRPPSREDLEHHGEIVLNRVKLPLQFLGFVMVALSNEFWRPTFEAIPRDRRLFLLPHCLSDRAVCRGTYNSVGLHCADCGSCSIADLQREAERLGYCVIVAEGTGSTLEKILEGDVDGIIGVACLDSLEKSFQRVAELGVPHMAMPLLRDGCVNTEAEVDEIRRLLVVETANRQSEPRSYVPLLRETTRMFQQPRFAELLLPYEESAAETTEQDDPLAPTSQIALEWLKEGGKRLRPFVTIAAYAVARHGKVVLDRGDLTVKTIPQSICQLALAIEALHKASLVHDDIEDDDQFRYGRPTLHHVYGVGQAINIGDYLIGLGYRLVAGETKSLGTDCIGEILNRLSSAHLEMCRGQGIELSWQNELYELHRPADVLAVHAMKTAPAFEVALYTGLRAAGVTVDAGVLRRFSTYIGEGFQVQNDLDDWREDDNNKRKRARDVLAGRPTILRAFAADTMYAQALSELADRNGQLDPENYADRVRNIYCQSGAFAKAEQLLGKLRTRAIDTTTGFPSVDLQELTRFLVRIVLPESVETRTSAR